MPHQWKNLLTVEVSEDLAQCRNCGANIIDIKNFKYAGETRAAATFTEELYMCRHCKTKFIIRYELFDSDGHINSKTFSSDINSPENQWQDNLTDEQKRLVTKHLKKCPECKERLDEELLRDAWFSSMFKKGIRHDHY